MEKRVKILIRLIKNNCHMILKNEIEKKGIYS